LAGCCRWRAKHLCYTCRPHTAHTSIFSCESRHEVPEYVAERRNLPWGMPWLHTYVRWGTPELQHQGRTRWSNNPHHRGNRIHWQRGPGAAAAHNQLRCCLPATAAQRRGTSPGQGRSPAEGCTVPQGALLL
jgi:hypothetical protein